MGDETGWEPEIVRAEAVEPARLDHVHSIRFDPDTAAHLRDRADFYETTVSGLIRRLVDDELSRPAFKYTVTYGDGSG